ncbi:MAG TPA: type II toxin-antitoxin system HicB family antitoxin [Methanotrichaceae archaeon]|nr:type II toxin-antitoxin system HicB family antitoxin [Methanotrichaceae archaeon]
MDIFAKCTQAQAALKRTQYKAIANGDEPYFVSFPKLDDVWATGRTVEDARRNFIEASLRQDSSVPAGVLDISPMGGQS